jgi:hypothetical protein
MVSEVMKLSGTSPFVICEIVSFISCLYNQSYKEALEHMWSPNFTLYMSKRCGEHLLCQNDMYTWGDIRYLCMAEHSAEIERWASLSNI